MGSLREHVISSTSAGTRSCHDACCTCTDEPKALSLHQRRTAGVCFSREVPCGWQRSSYGCARLYRDVYHSRYHFWAAAGAAKAAELLQGMHMRALTTYWPCKPVGGPPQQSFMLPRFCSGTGELGLWCTGERVWHLHLW